MSFLKKQKELSLSLSHCLTPSSRNTQTTLPSYQTRTNHTEKQNSTKFHSPNSRSPQSAPKSPNAWRIWLP